MEYVFWVVCGLCLGFFYGKAYSLRQLNKEFDAVQLNIDEALERAREGE